MAAGTGQRDRGETGLSFGAGGRGVACLCAGMLCGEAKDEEVSVDNRRTDVRRTMIYGVYRRPQYTSHMRRRGRVVRNDGTHTPGA